MNKTVLLVVSGSWQPGLTFSYRRAFEALGFRVEQFDLGASLRAAVPAPRALDPLVNRLLPYVEVPSFAHKANRAMVMRAIELDPALILVSCNEQVRPAALVQLKIALPRAKVVSIFPDTLFNLRDQVIAGLPIYDLFCTHTRAGMPYLERLGCRAPFYVPLAADPALHHPMTLSPEDQRTYGCDVVYVGNWRPEHEALFARLEGFDLAIWGGDQWTRSRAGSWVRSRWRGRALLTGEEYAKAHIAAKVCLNPIDPLNLPGHNQRVFELPACRVFSLVTRTEDTAEIFREGETIALFGSPEELLDKVQHYLAQPEDRARIAAAAYELVVNGGHTYQDRVRSILDRLGVAI